MGDRHFGCIDDTLKHFKGRGHPGGERLLGSRCHVLGHGEDRPLNGTDDTLVGRIAGFGQGLDHASNIDFILVIDGPCETPPKLRQDDA